MTADAAAYKPGMLDIGLQMLFGGQSPADAAEHLRELQDQNANRPLQAQAMQRWMGLFGGGAPQSVPQAQPAPDPGPQDLPSAMALGLGRTTGASPQPSPPPPPQTAAPGGFDINDPATQQMLFGGAAFGMPGAKEALDIAKAVQPDIQIGPDGTPYNKHDPAALSRRFANRSPVNGSIVDLNNPDNEGQFFGDAPVKGAMPVKDRAGNITDWQMPEGALGALASSSFATSRGQAKGTAPFDFVNVPGPKGAPRVISKQAAAGGDFVGAAPDDVQYNTEGAKAGQGRMQGYVAAGQNAGKTLTTLGRLRQLDQGVGGGKLAPLGADVASYASSLGIQIDPKLPNKEAIVALTNRLVLDAAGGSLGPGISNSDTKMFQSMQPSLANTPQGRGLMVDYAESAAQRQQRVTGMASQWEKRYGRIDARDSAGRTFEQNVAAWADRNPLRGRDGRPLTARMGHR